MFITSISTENWIGNRNMGQMIENPNWDIIENAIRELNANTKTLVTLETDGEANMGIGGGSGLYVVYATFDNMAFYNLIDSSKNTNTIELVTGGQLGDFPSNRCVSLEKALKAVKTFVEKGKIEKSLEWEQE